MTFRLLAAAAFATAALTSCDKDDLDTGVVDAEATADVSTETRAANEALAAELAGDWVASDFEFFDREVIGSDAEELDSLLIAFTGIEGASGELTWSFYHEEGDMQTYAGPFAVVDEVLMFAGTLTKTYPDKAAETERAAFDLDVVMADGEFVMTGDFDGKELRLVAEHQ